MYAQIAALLLFVSLLAQSAAGGAIRVVDETGQPVAKFEVMLHTADRGCAPFKTGRNGGLPVTDEFELAAVLDVIVRAEGYASKLISCSGNERKDLLTGKTAVVLPQGREVRLLLRMPEGVTVPKDFMPEVYFEQQMHWVRIMRQPGNRVSQPPSAWDLDVGRAAKQGDAFLIRITEKPHPFYITIHHPGFLRFFEAGPFTEKDIKDGVLEIEIPRPAGVDVTFDPGDNEPHDRPFESVRIEVGWRIPGNRTISAATNPLDEPGPTIRLTDLAPGTYRLAVRTLPKAGQATDPKTQVNPGVFSDSQDCTLTAGELAPIKFRYMPFDPEAFRGERTAVVRLLNPDGAAAKGKKLRIAFFDGHYGFLPVFDGLVPGSGEVELEKLTDRIPNRMFRSYWVWLEDRHIGNFDLGAVSKPQRFEFQRALAVGDQAPEIEFIDVATRENVSLKSLHGKIVLLELWATWCGPCQPAMKKLNDLADAQKEKWKERVALVAVSIDESPELASKHAKQRGWTSLRHVWSDHNESDSNSKVERAFSVDGVPTAFLLDTDGKVVWYGHPVVDKPSLPERIEELLSRNRQPEALLDGR